MIKRDRFFKVTSPKSQKAATLVEFAIVFPIILLLVLAIIDMILFLVARGTVERAAKQAAAYAAVVDGLENDPNQAAIDLVLDKAKKLPSIVLGSSFVELRQENGVEYIPPYRDPINKTGIDYRAFPLGVTIRADYRPILPFLPNQIEVSGYAYREKSETSSLPVPLDCLGNQIINGQLPPLSRCPCPGVNDPLSRIDPSNPSACKCVQGAAANQDHDLCQCIGDNVRYDQATDSCVCRIKHQTVGQDEICRCPVNSTPVGEECKCLDGYTDKNSNPNILNCGCRFAKPANSVDHPTLPCTYICSIDGFEYNPNNGRCECKRQASSCPADQVLVTTNGQCACAACPANTVPDPTKTRCICSPDFAATCGGPEFTTFHADGSCQCKGICEFEDENGQPIYSEGNCICDKDLLFARCGGEQNSNLTYCNCKCINPGPNSRCECNYAALIKWCGDPKPQGQGGLPIDREHCGCKSGQCQGITVLNDQGICVCPDSIDEVVVRKGCKDNGQIFNPDTCQCATAPCPKNLINDRGECFCPANTLEIECGKLGLPILDKNKCLCGEACGPNMEPNAQGQCVCSELACPEGAAPDADNNCACVCANSGLQPIPCAGKGGIDVCIDDFSCIANPYSCYCDADGVFRPRGR